MAIFHIISVSFWTTIAGRRSDKFDQWSARHQWLLHVILGLTFVRIHTLPYTDMKAASNAHWEVYTQSSLGIGWLSTKREELRSDIFECLNHLHLARSEASEHTNTMTAFKYCKTWQPITEQWKRVANATTICFIRFVLINALVVTVVGYLEKKVHQIRMVYVLHELRKQSTYLVADGRVSWPQMTLRAIMSCSECRTLLRIKSTMLRRVDHKGLSRSGGHLDFLRAVFILHKMLLLFKSDTWKRCYFGVMNFGNM